MFKKSVSIILACVMCFSVAVTAFAVEGDAEWNAQSGAGYVPPESSVTPDAVPVEGVSYTVKQYDTLGKLSVNFYGSYGYQNDIYKANKTAIDKTYGKMNPGMVLTIPNTVAKNVSIISPAVAGEGEELYVVKAEETLGIISSKFFGTPSKFKVIFDRNNDRIKNVNLIYEGQIIVIPSKAAVAAATPATTTAPSTYVPNPADAGWEG